MTESQNFRGTRGLITLAVVTLIVTVIVLSFADLNAVFQRLRSLDFRVAAVGLAAFLGATIAGALRLRVIFGTDSGKRFIEILDLSILHGFFAAVLPARLGDLSFPPLAKRLTNAPLSTGAAQIFTLRVHDFVTSNLLLVVSILWLGNSRLDVLPLLTGTSVIFVGIVAGLLMLPFVLRALARIPHRSRSHAVVAKGAGFLHRAIDSCRQVPPARHARIALATVVRWLLLAAVTFFTLHAVGVEVRAVESLFIVTSVNLAITMSVQTIAGFGVADAAFGVALSALGTPLETAISDGFAARLVRLTYLFGVFAVWMVLRKKLLAIPEK